MAPISPPLVGVHAAFRHRDAERRQRRGVHADSVLIGHWAGLFVPKGTPLAVIERLHAELQTVLKSKERQDRFIPRSIEPAPGSLPYFARFIATERERLGKIAREAGMKSEN